MDLWDTDLGFGLMDPCTESSINKEITLTRSRNFRISILEPIDNRFKLRCASWVNFHDNTLTIWDGFYVRFDEWLRNLIITWTRLNILNRVKEWFATTCTLKGSTLFFYFTFLFLEVLTRTQGIHGLGYLVDFPLRLYHKCH